MNDALIIMKEFNAKENVTLHEILARFQVNSLDELTIYLSGCIRECLEKDRIDNAFFNELYSFILSVLLKNAITRKETIELNSFYHMIKGMLHDELRPYNKGLKNKDGRYHILSSIQSKYKNMEVYIEALVESKKGKNTFKIIWFIINELKKPDYLFRLFELHPDYVNLRNENNTHLFLHLCNYYMAHLKELSERDINYYKRIIVMMLESDRLSLSNKELFSLLKNIENNKRGSDAANLIHISFISNEIDRHYEVINKDARLNCVNYCFRECPITFMRRSSKTRVDLSDDFIFSIDSTNGTSFQNRLFDDAFSYRDNGNGTHTLFMHIPDVDYYIKKDSPTDLYMRAIGESVYAKGYRRPMLSYDAAKVCSLKQGEHKPAITFAITVDNNGKVIDVDFYKSVIRVNYNLSIASADVFMYKIPDERFIVLKKMRDLLALICSKRKATIGNRSGANIIMDEMNIITDLATASYFEQNGIIFPYKNFAGLRNKRSVEDVSKCEEFAERHELDKNDLILLYSIFNINNRVYYDTINHGNTEFNGRAIGNVGNPLRQYISLETDRLIKDVVISGEKNIDFWLERIERDCIEYTETSAKIKQLYQRK